MAVKLELSLLGPPEIHKADLPVTGFNSNKVFALLCYLAVTGETHLRPSLASLFWGDFPEASAQNNLRKALTNLRQVVGSYVDITRQTVAFNQNSTYWLDVRDFETSAGTKYPEREIQQIEYAVELYRGDFLAGFYLHKAPAFENWILIQRARLREMAIKALHKLSIHYTRLGEQHYPTAIGYVRQLLRLEPFQEEAHRQLMLLLGLNGQRSVALAQYKICEQILRNELNVTPGVDTLRLFEQIRDDTLEPIPPLPPFLTQLKEDSKPPLFVGRQGELEILGDALENAQGGKGQVVFIVGGPGRGKTALLESFARQSMAMQPDLLVAKGKCSAYAGVGDPYAPFREILGMLTGDVETQWSAGAISTAHARRLWRAMILTSQALIERSTHIINTIVDGPALLSRMTAASAPFISDGLKRLKAQVNKRDIRQVSIDQTNLFEQVSRVLSRLAETHPILLILDDLQWIDKASAGLLFHLGRRLSNRSILIACAYRPDEISFRQDGGVPGDVEKHPLEKLLGEFKGRFGNTWIDLAQSDAIEGRAFINAYIDSEPNQLNQDFRETLYSRTAGHPLFTIELLRSMQAERNLVQESDGSWLIESEPDWGQMPVRVEGVIGQRIDRLNPELRDILTVASVEGDIFSAQVIADVQGMNERKVLNLLSGTLQKGHRLVRGNKEITVGSHHLSQYSFAHVLYRDYAYHNLSPGERRLLHHQVGSRLEKYYQGQTELIAVQLATHFVGDPGKEKHYSQLAGEWAASRFANDEAIYYLSRALELTPETEFSERYELLLGLEKVHDLVGDREAQQQDLIALRKAADTLSNLHYQATSALQQATLYWSLSDNSAAIAECHKAISFLESHPNPELEAEILRRWALSLIRLGDYKQARIMFEKAIKQAQRAGSRWLEAENLRHLGNSYVEKDDPHSAIHYFEKSLPILRVVGNRTDQIRILHSMAMSNFMLFEYQKAKDKWEQAMHISREVGSAFYSNVMQYSYASVFEACGLYEVAREQYMTSLEMSREVGNSSIETRALCSIGYTTHFLNENQQALPYFNQALQVVREFHESYVEAYLLTAFGNVFLALNQHPEAVENFKGSILLHQELGQECAALEPMAGMAQVNLEEGDLIQAMAYVEDILSYLEEGDLPSTEQPLQIYLRCYHVLQANHDPRTSTILATAIELLQEWAARIEEDELRASFLENVAANRAIIAAWSNKIEK